MTLEYEDEWFHDNDDWERNLEMNEEEDDDDWDDDWDEDE